MRIWRGGESVRGLYFYDEDMQEVQFLQLAAFVSLGEEQEDLTEGPTGRSTTR